MHDIRAIRTDPAAFDAAMARPRQRVGPPLQAHFAGQWLTHLLVHTRNLDIEGIYRQQRAALRRRHEQRRCVADKIVRAYQLSAEAGRLPASGRIAHGTAISAAATRLLSPIMML
ncbi:hypothetical protein GALL_481780 [mine drainage metagenome]|uniref:Uncharacterized protein n=1 Tax=mine drainage metagenome TaxID=410659 RepID=A0A1J5PHF0_9ZZZZ